MEYRSGDSSDSGNDDVEETMDHEVDNLDEDSSDDEDEEQRQPARPYNELLQMLQSGSDSKEPARKKRKTSHEKRDTHVHSESEEVNQRLEQEIDAQDDDELLDRAASDYEHDPEVHEEDVEVEDEEGDKDGKPAEIETGRCRKSSLTSRVPPQIRLNLISQVQIMRSSPRKYKPCHRISGVWTRPRRPADYA